MKISFASLIVFKSILVDFCTCSADTDTDYQSAFLKNWRATSKKENRKRNLGDIFLDAADAQGGSDVVHPAVYGGTEVDPRRKYKFFVYLGGCGGTLVASNVVLSAAHCEKVAPTFVTLGLHKIYLDVDEGDTDDEFLQLEHIPIERSEIHPQYDPSTTNNDYWVIKLKWASQLYANNVVVLDTPDDDFVLKSGDELVIMGFGATEDSFGSNVLLETTVNYVTNSDCVQPNAGYSPDEITDMMICAAAPDKDTCQGDSGGPLIDKVTGKLVGIVSWGNGCALKGFPGVYASVSAGYDFISSMISSMADTKTRKQGNCVDRGGFYDGEGVDYNCLWYEKEKHCTWYGDQFPHTGLSLTANDACCVCGGGTRVNSKASKRI